MRAIRSKSLVFRASKNDPAWDPFLDLRRVAAPDTNPLESSTNITPPPSYSTTPSLSGPEHRPFTANTAGAGRDYRDSLSRPRTATTFNRHTLLVKSLRRHDIDPHHSSLIDDDCIGIGLGSPNAASVQAGSAAAAPPAPKSTRGFVRCAKTDSVTGRDRLVQDQGYGKDLKRRPSTWRAFGSLFGKRHQDERPEDAVPPLPQLPSLYSEVPIERPSTQHTTTVDEANTPRFSSHLARRRRSEAGPRPRKSLTLRRDRKPANLEHEIPELPTKNLCNAEPPSLQDINIPSSRMDRFSVMFAPVLQHQNQPLVPIQRPGQNPSSGIPLSPASPGHHSRSMTAPCSLPSPSTLIPPPPSRAAPVPPRTSMDLGTGISQSNPSTSSAPHSPLSSISTDLEHYYLPSRYQCTGDASSLSSQSTPTFSTFPDHLLQRMSSCSSASATASQSDAGAVVHEGLYDATETSTGTTTTTTLVLPSPPLSAYLSARPYPSPAAPSPTYGYGYDAPHSPLVHIARSVTATTTRPRLYAASLDRDVDSAGQSVCLSDSRCGTPVLVQVIGPGRRTSQWGMVVGEEATV